MPFEELVKKIGPTLKRITYRLNGHCSFFNDEDLFQEALIHLWQAFRQGKLDDKTDSYILQGCYFHLKNYLRKVKGKEKLLSLEAKMNEEGASFEELLSMRNDNTQPYLDYLDDKMLVERIRNNGLSKREKVILSFYGDGLTTREIGRRIGVSHVMVVKLMAGIRVKCRKYSELV